MNLHEIMLAAQIANADKSINGKLAECSATLGYSAKNKLKITTASSTAYGVTFTVKSDGTVVVNGTATSNGIFKLGSISNPGTRTFTLTGCPAGGTYSTYQMCCRVGSSGISESYEYGSGVTFTITGNFDVAIRIGSGTVLNNLVFRPMIRDSSISDNTFEPYKMTVDERLSALENSIAAVNV